VVSWFVAVGVVDIALLIVVVAFGEQVQLDSALRWE
jgi:hypothetical protein